MEPYYFIQLPKLHQAAYTAIKTGLTALSPSFPVPKLENRDLAEIFFKLRLDCPEIFYGTGFHYRFYPNSSNVEMIPEYLFDKPKIKEHQKAMAARITKLIRPAATLSEKEKELYIHDFICNHVRYDKLKKPYSHEIIGPLGQGVGVCEGIAKTVKILCDTLGLWCIIAISEANPHKHIKYRHAWNIVCIEGQYYHLDVTFDNSVSHDGVIRYDYFNLADTQIFRDHEPVIYPTPDCIDQNQFYYKVQNQSFTKAEDVKKRVVQAIRKGNPLIFNWRGGHLTGEVLTQLLDLLEQGAQQKGRHAKVALNRSQAIFHVTFTDELPTTEVRMEEVNEGECQSHRET